MGLTGTVKVGSNSNSIDSANLAIFVHLISQTKINSANSAIFLHFISQTKKGIRPIRPFLYTYFHSEQLFFVDGDRQFRTLNSTVKLRTLPTMNHPRHSIPYLPYNLIDAIEIYKGISDDTVG